MRILIVSDIHANPAALAAIREDFDTCLFLGDLVDYGLDPAPCIEWVRQKATFSVRGNHDHGVAQKVGVEGATGFRYLTGVTRSASIKNVSEVDRRYLADLPTTRALTLAGKRFFLVHATPRDPLDEYAPPDVEFWAKRLEGIDADYVCVGHTHVQFVLQVGATMVVNPGSVGLPRDGDPRVAYALITDDGPVLKRVEYPVDEAVTAVHRSNLPTLAKQMLVEVYRTGRLEKKNGNGDSKFGQVSANGVV